ncbi:hypothetical protein ACFVGY_28055 [Streptomyces sp. NPDC127106]|uniref:hypothetical protein n=1 Tax=Streptomyces sp. NPDC127106 TaxID=3345360 RepID=UPI00363C56A2
MTITEGTADGGIDRLNAFDGLFLRAEHLNLIQDYARELALAVGACAGPGTVEGYEVTVQDGTLRVGAGLAVNAEGRPLRSERLVTLPLTGLKPGLDGFWWVEVAPATRDHGEAPVQGSYCDDPCSGTGTTRHPYTAEGVRIRLVEDTERGLDGQLPAARRNFLASRVFGAERTAHSAWPYGTAAATLPRSWGPPAAAPSRSAAVRLAVLLRVPGTADGFEVDVWTARRDRGAAPPYRYGQSRLGMRPWDVYIAQILQFQSQLAQVLAAREAQGASGASGAPGATGPREGPGAGSAAAGPGIGPLLEQLALLGDQQFLRTRTKDQLGREVARIVAGLGAHGGPAAVAPPPAAAEGPYSLEQLGIVELPPAGYLPVRADEPEEGDGDGGGGDGGDGGDGDGGDGDVDRSVPGRIETLLGQQAYLRYCRCGPADIAEAVEEARNRDRIRLDTPSFLDVLVPVDEEGEPAGDWVAFVRSRRRICYSPGSAGTAADRGAENRGAANRGAANRG